MVYTFGFEKLEVYQDVRLYVKEIYRLTDTFPANEQYGLIPQLRRASVSTISNIVEGTSRFSNREKIRFLEISYGSLMETYCQLQIAVDLGYLNENTIVTVKEKVEKIANKINALSRYYQKNIKKDEQINESTI